MIGRLKGTVEARFIETCLLDVGGVGYELTCSAFTLDEMAVGTRAVVEVYTHVREDQIALFGFSSQLEKDLFLSLLSVNGVGPKMAIKILSAATPSHIARSIEAGDVKALSLLPKVGKKTAEQLVVSLKGKVGSFLDTTYLPLNSQGSVAAGALPLVEGARHTLHHEIESALQNLGFRPVEVERVMMQLSTRAEEKVDNVELTLEEGVRFALQTLGGMR